jgi:hypothetical protein
VSVSIKRPRTEPEIKALIRERKRNIAKLEAALRLSLPAQDRKHLQMRLKGEKNNMHSWIDYLEKKAA